MKPRCALHAASSPGATTLASRGVDMSMALSASLARTR